MHQEACGFAKVLGAPYIYIYMCIYIYIYVYIYIYICLWFVQESDVGGFVKYANHARLVKCLPVASLDLGC